MAINGEREAVEFFHLRFLQFLMTGEARNLISVKGGCNLRFFFNSPRYSEDIDLDVTVIRADTLGKRVEKALEALGSVVRTNGLAITERSSDQGDTTQRWKVGLALHGRETPFHTKIEFSRRRADQQFEAGEVAYEQVPESQTAAYELQSVRATHYLLFPAIKQKVAALALRKVPQARDVFDLNVLFPLLNDSPPGLVRADELPEAIARAEAIDYDAFRSQVVAYLPPAIQEQYDDVAWEFMKEDVIKRLGALK